LIESFNGRLRDEFMHVKEFVTLYDLRAKMKTWWHDYNHYRPHGSLGHLSPSEFIQKWSVKPKEATPLQF
ncbi:MAG TPA: integrase core domain-containing protein, partial [Alcaligenes sp.]|nr:integrase core domain-containing protein [Alcaligenes sp.]